MQADGGLHKGPSLQRCTPQSRGPAGFPLAVGLWPRGVPWQKQRVQVTQRRVSVMSHNTVNVPCFLGLFGQLPGHHLTLPGISFLWTNTSSCGSGTTSPDTKNRGSAGASQPQVRRTAWAAGLSVERQGQREGGEPWSSGFQGELRVHSAPKALENSQVSICL